ncbi:DNA topoisomerase [Delphinella strobiligena]|nr:DNA topoisomerase [Delphinella strobiligena]
MKSGFEGWKRGCMRLRRDSCDGDTLHETIIGLAQDFVGSNNINYLEPIGNSGSRLQGGRDAAEAHLLNTKLSPWARRIFHTVDEALLTYNTVNGKTIEPELYMPLVPTILVNGADDFHVGWKRSIPKYNPEDIIANLRRRMRGSSKSDMMYRQINQKGTNEVEITDQPVRVWTEDFKDTLDNILKAEFPSSVRSLADLDRYDKIRLVISLDDQSMRRALGKGLVEQFEMSTMISSANLVALNMEGQIQSYDTELDILEEFYLVRIAFYKKRKQYLLGEVQNVLDKICNQLRFIQILSKGEIALMRSKAELVAELQRLNFKCIPASVKATKKRKLEPSGADKHDENMQDGASSCEYLLGMIVWCLTQEHAEQLRKLIVEKQFEIAELSKRSPEKIYGKQILKTLSLHGKNSSTETWSKNRDRFGCSD